VPYQDDPTYQPGSWADYEAWELGNFAHLFMRRAEHRSDDEKARKDLFDAEQYAHMLVEMVRDRIEQFKGVGE
jgi:hypothetical protein